MEVRLVTAVSRGFFFSLARISIKVSPLTIVASLPKKTLWHPGYTLLDPQNSPYPTQPHSIIAKYCGCDYIAKEYLVNNI